VIPFEGMLLPELIGATLLLILLITTFAGVGREGSAGMTRWMGMLCLIGVLLAAAMPTYWQALLVLGVVWNVQRQHPPSSHINYLETVLAVCGAYLLLIQYSWAWFIPVFLWTLCLMGTYMGLWGMYSVLVHKSQKYAHSWTPTLFKWGKQTLAPFTFTIEERGQRDEQGNLRPGAKAGDVWCGQFMTNFTQAIFCITITATVGLVVSGTTPWVLLTVPIQSFVLLHYLRIHSGGVGQWVPHLGVVGLMVVGLHDRWLAANCALVLAVLFTLWLWKRQRLGKEGGADSGRLVEWWEMYWVWRNANNWWTYLFGFGIRSWVQVAYDKALMKAKTTGQTIHNIFTMAHNEYIQQLFEFGMVGLFALMATSWHIWNAAYALHKGLWLVVGVLISIAMLSYPWAFYHRAVVPAVGQKGAARFQEHRFGSPALFWITFMVMVLVHG